MKLRKALYDEITAHALETFPHECCGLVVERDASLRVVRVTNVQNERHAEDPERFPRTAEIAFTMGPEAAPQLIDHDRGRAVIRAFYHSHPQHAAYFSAEDKKQATVWDEPSFPDATQIVVSVFDRRVKDVKAFRWEEEQRDFVEVPFSVSDAREPMQPHYEVTGSGSPAIVFTHGLAATGATWAAQVAELSASFRTVTWDLRGHGRSPSPPGDCRLSDLANDLRSVLDAASIDRAVILGHSAGGVVAMQFALDHPERCAGLVLIGTASECNAKANEFYETLATMAVERGMAPVRRRLGLEASGSEAPDVDPQTFAKVARVMANLHHEPLTSRLGEVRCPTLIIVGEKDFLGAGGSVILSRNITGSELHIVPQRGHGIFLEDPKGFNELVGKFLHRLSGTLPRETGEG